MRRHRSLLVSTAVFALFALGACSGTAANEGSSASSAASSTAVGETSSADSSTASEASSAGEEAPSSSENKGDVKIGLFNELTGPYATMGVDINEGFQVFLDENGGKLGGYTAVLTTADPGVDSSQATSAIRDLVEKHEVAAVVGPINTAAANAVIPYVEKSQVPLVITTAGADSITQAAPANYVYRVGTTSSQTTMPLGEYACKTLGYQRVAIVALDYTFGWEAAGGFARTYTDAGCAVAQEIYGPLGTQDWAPYVNNIDRSVDAVFIGTAGADGVRLLKAYRGFGLDLPIVAYGGTVDETILQTEGADAKGVISTGSYAPSLDNEANKKLVAAFTKNGKTTNQYAEDGYAAAQVLDAALSKLSGPVTRDDIRDSLKDVQVDAPRGPLHFDDYGQAVFDTYVRVVDQSNGHWENMVTDTIDDVSQFWTYSPDDYKAMPDYVSLKGTWVKN
jgi:branched-chain amino acid transport system substrate-binding protein